MPYKDVNVGLCEETANRTQLLTIASQENNRCVLTSRNRSVYTLQILPSQLSGHTAEVPWDTWGLPRSSHTSSECSLEMP